VLDKVSGGRKADAANAGLNIASAPYVCVLDTDAVLEKGALLSIMEPILNDPAHVVASGGLVRVANGCTIENGEVKDVRLPRKPIEALQTIEYLRSFLIARQGWARLDMLLIISGAFGVFRRDLCRAIGGFRNSAIGEDLDIVIRLHRHLRNSGEPYRIAFIPDPVCWTEAPSQISALASQRARWQNGLAEALCRHRDMIGNSRYGRIGLAALPYQCIFELCAPAVEVVGWLALVASAALGYAEARCLAAFLAGYVFACSLSAGSLLLEELIFHRYSRWGDLARLLGWCLVEPVVYQGLNTIWRLRGLVDFVTGNSSWKSQPRVGFGPAKG
jgi:cellulose synthase/poly-beta-1,6-N-acetylglucosamine synthase-like glycosyltransferase